MAEDPHDPAFIAVSVFGAIYKTLQLFEEADALGRRVSWAFGGPQLLVVPRAGRWENAFYERESRSLQFFFFQPPGASTCVYTSHSQDIVSHETAHAIIDGVAPSLYSSLAPESLALHEALANLTAVSTAFRSKALVRRVLEDTGGSIKESRAFSGLAEQFAEGLDKRRLALRDLLNDKRMRDVPAEEPHALSEVLSGAFYKVTVKLHEEIKQSYGLGRAPNPSLVEHSETAKQGSEERGAAKALFLAAERLQRLFVRGLDYLPPGEASFADFARAALAADVASHPQSSSQRTWLAEEMLARGVVARRAELESDGRVGQPVRELGEVALEDLVSSDFAAYDFVNKHRRFLRVPANIPFVVHPRLVVAKKSYHRDGDQPTERELILKVSWTEEEPSLPVPGLPKRRRFIAGTTLAITWRTRALRALLTTGDGGEAQRLGRDRMLARLVDGGHLQPEGSALQRYARCAVPFNKSGGTLRVHNAARLLHLAAPRGGA